MLFCTLEFLEFFVLVFAVYWLVRWPWARLGILLAAAPFFVPTSWNYLCAQLGSAHTLYDPGAALSLLSDLPTVAIYWMAALIGASALIACRLGHHQARVWLLMSGSFFFYSCFNKWLALIICVSTAMDYLIARGLDALTSQRLRKLLLTVSLVGNLGLLCYFKYANFFIDSFRQVLHTAGVHTSSALLDVILPIGISFYTFEAINYTVDVYRRRAHAEKNLLNFMLFITFFPHLVAGPIVRARDFLPQIHRRKHWDWARMQLGVQFLLMGLFKKLAIADRMALFADPIFGDAKHPMNPGLYNTGAIWLAVIAYTLQIYCDFSGYTDMAVGLAHMFGYKLAQNFNMPYLATNVSEFWHRWHISLSSWLRDYLFIPLGGSRGTNRQTNRNLLATMTLGGLWHGANWTFVVWGILHGVMLIVHRVFRSFCKTRVRLDWVLQSPPGTLLRLFVTLLSVMVGWVFFRAVNFHDAATVLHRMFIPHSAGLGSPLHNRSLWYTVGLVVLCHVLAHRGWWKKVAVRLPAPVMGFGYATVLTVALLLAPVAGKTFIYFNF